jgi:hypothetical protein
MENPFITVHTSDADVEALINIGVPLMGSDGRIKWAAVENATGIKYSRGWLILRHEWLAIKNPSALLNVTKLVSEKFAEAVEQKRSGEFDGDRDIICPIVQELRDSKELSWGEIAVRCGIPESKVRACYKKTAGKKDKGLRIGKGGRFAYDEPRYYMDNMKHEGAYIPVEIKGRRPQLEELLNYRKPEPVAPVKVRKPRAKKPIAS